MINFFRKFINSFKKGDKKTQLEKIKKTADVILNQIRDVGISFEGEKIGETIISFFYKNCKRGTDDVIDNVIILAMKKIIDFPIVLLCLDENMEDKICYYYKDTKFEKAHLKAYLITDSKNNSKIFFIVKNNSDEFEIGVSVNSRNDSVDDYEKKFKIISNKNEIKSLVIAHDGSSFIEECIFKNDSINVTESDVYSFISVSNLKKLIVKCTADSSEKLSDFKDISSKLIEKNKSILELSDILKKKTRIKREESNMSVASIEIKEISEDDSKQIIYKKIIIQNGRVISCDINDENLKFQWSNDSEESFKLVINEMVPYPSDNLDESAKYLFLIKYEVSLSYNEKNKFIFTGNSKVKDLEKSKVLEDMYGLLDLINKTEKLINQVLDGESRKESVLSISTKKYKLEYNYDNNYTISYNQISKNYSNLNKEHVIYRKKSGWQSMISKVMTEKEAIENTNTCNLIMIVKKLLKENVRK